MTSQKRYRHQQDSGNNGTRFRDIPPRFKRQKSSSSPTRPSTPSNTDQSCRAADTQETNSPKLSSVILPDQVSPSSSIGYQVEDRFGSQVQQEVDIHQTLKNATSDIVSMPHKTNSVFVSSPWKHIYETDMNHQQSSHISLGTNFGYKMNSSPLYPWAPNSRETNLSRENGGTGSLMWPNKVTNSYTGPRMHSYSSYVMDNESTNQHFLPQHNPGIIWGMPASITKSYPVSSSPVLKISESSVSVKTNENEQLTKDTEKIIDQRVIDYSDPDVRTIEMLRELERVADQKENEQDAFKSDKQSLVSHHLRMLMCAVDRYTEGIEDELATASRHDEVTPSSDSRGSTPGFAQDPCKNWTNDKGADITGNKPLLDLGVWSPRTTMQSTWNKSLSPVKSCTERTNHASLLNSSSQSQVVDGKGADQDIAAWDLWSSQTFDFCGVLMSQSVDSKVNFEKERKLL